MLSRRDALDVSLSELDAKIAIERARPAPDETLIKSWTIARLATEDEVARLDRIGWRKRRMRRYDRIAA
ncbi:MAG: hypothetical protein AAFQ21_07345 [Pseudomonadota bacterium]